MCCNGVIISILQLHDGVMFHFALGFEPVKVEEPAISSVKDWDPLEVFCIFCQGVVP